MSFCSFISRRYFFGRKKMFSSFLSAVAVLGVALGVFALVVVMSVMFGFARDLEQKLIGFNAHVVAENIESVPDFLKNDVVSSSLIVEGEGVIAVAGEAGLDAAQGVKVRGMEDAEKGAVLGSELAAVLGFQPDGGGRVTIISPLAKVSPAGELMPEKISLPVVDVFHSGYFEHDSKVVIIPQKEAIRLFGAEKRLHIWLKNSGAAKDFAQKLSAAYPEAKVSTWTDLNRKLFAALKLERIAMFILLALIIVIASISIVSVIFMYVFLRRKEIAILASVGATRKDIMGVFLKMGAYIGAAGTLLGETAGVFACYYLQHKKVALPASYYLNQLPVVISWPFFGAVAAFGIAFAVFAAVYPASQASSLQPQELLRYE